MSHHSEHHNFLEHRLLHSPMSKIYIFQALMMFTRAMVGAFAPLYLYQLGYSIAKILSLYLWFSVFFLLIIPLGIFIVRKIGFKYTILVSLPFYLIFALLFNFAHLSWLVPLIGYVFLAAHAAIFWPAFHLEIAASGNNNKRGSEIGTFQIISTLFATLAPFVAGFSLQFFGYIYVFILGTVLMGIGALVLILSENVKVKKHHFGYKDYFRLVKSKKYETSKKAFSAEGIEGLLFLYCWAIILFIILGNDFFIIGSLMTFVSLISVIMVWKLKSRIDHQNKEHFLQFSAKLYSFGWFMRGIVLLTGGIFVYITEAFSKLFVDLFRLPYVSIFYNNAKRGSFMDYIILRELYLHTTRIMFMIPLVLILFLVGESFTLFLILTLIASLVAMRMAHLKEE